MVTVQLRAAQPQPFKHFAPGPLLQNRAINRPVSTADSSTKPSAQDTKPSNWLE
jgi:hypothetical protein